LSFLHAPDAPEKPFSVFHILLDIAVRCALQVLAHDLGFLFVG
jgi:hypothetical protein